jgi:SAM-dependent methyltransferase
MSIKNWFRKVQKALPAAPSSKFVSCKYAVNLYDLLPANAYVLEFGVRKDKGVYPIGRPRADTRLVTVDIQELDGADIVADAHDLHMIEDNSVDCVIAANVLEHVEQPHVCMAEFYRVIKPGGIVYIDTPFIFPFHAAPNDFYRFSHNGLEILCRDFDKVDGGFARGPASTMQVLLVHFLGMLFSFGFSPLYVAMTYVFSWLLFWVKYLDVVLSRFEFAYILHTSAYFVGRKQVI